MRQTQILFAVLLIYFLPSHIYHATGEFYFVYQALWSSIFIRYLCRANTLSADIIILVEITCIIVNFLALYGYSVAHKSGFAYAQYEHIMNACFVIELIIAGVGMWDARIYTRLLSMRNNYSDKHKRYKLINQPVGSNI